MPSPGKKHTSNIVDDATDDDPGALGSVVLGNFLPRELGGASFLPRRWAIGHVLVALAQACHQKTG